MAEKPETRALTAALSGPAWTTRTGGGAMHIANRHVERWAPETNASRVGSMRSLGFVDRLVSPWLETAQRSMGLRMFSSPTHTRSNERQTNNVSWVFPRPWYQDELDWMAAAREVGTETATSDAQPSMLTTRGTYVAPQAQLRPNAAVMPSALYEYVAPSLSIAQPSQTSYTGEDRGTTAPASQQAYSPLVSLAAVQAAELMNRAVAPLVSPSQTQPAMATQMGRITPALRTVLNTMLERASVPTAPAQASLRAPEMVTPPAPRADDGEPATTEVAAATPAMTMADQVAIDLNTQRAQVAQLQVIAQREQAVVRAAEVQAVAQRAEAEMRQRTIEQRPVAQTPPVAPASAASPVAPATPAAIDPAATERARIEERVMQRVAERVAAQRLHEGARAEAAVHARTLEERREEPAPVAAAVQPPAEILAAIATLPPQLAGVLTQGLQQPGGALRAITQVNEALRAAELIARGAATNTTFEATRGPRVMLPAGLGGLVSAVDRAHGPTMSAAMMSAPSMTPIATEAPFGPQAERAYRVPTLPWVAPSTSSIGSMNTTAMPSARVAPTSALGATTTAAPQALTHVAWADRWLARFAGASPRSLETMHAASAGSPTATMAHLASIAPQAVFVASMFDGERAPAPESASATTSTPSMVSPAAPSADRMPRLIPAAPPPVQRFDDSAETPDDVFAAIAASASRARKTPAAAASPSQAPALSEPSAPAASIERPTYADHVAHAVPPAPHAGLAAQLASSPFAPALRHVLALPSAQSFDVRSLFGSSLSATYLAGLLAPTSHELAVTNPMPAWAQWSPAIADAPGAAIGERAVPGFDPAYVAPDMTSDAAPSTPSLSSDGSVESSPAPTDVAAAPFAPTTQYAPLTTLRSALLSWTGDVGPAGVVGAPTMMTSATTTETAASQAMTTPSPARSLVESMSMPMVGETEPSSIGGWTAPGAIADRAYGYSLAHERSTADLSFDFVPPELVLAARVYGLGPSEAAQAARLALAGPGQLTAMANIVERTFVNAMEIDAQRREGGRAITTAYPTATGEILAALAPSVQQPAGAPPAPTAMPSSPPSPGIPASPEMPSLIGSATHSAFGVDRRAPRGAFLWPAATVAALGLSASAPDGEQSMSVAALELLAAQAVAEIGTYAALDESPSAVAARDEEAADVAQPTRATAPGLAPTPIGAEASASRSAAEAHHEGVGHEGVGEPAEADVLGTAGAMVAPARRARFDALYVALSQSPSGRNLSPAARAARALALAGRGEDAPTSAFERAATVWDVLPVVYATEGMSTEEAVHTQAELGAKTPRGIAARASLRRPGLGGAADFVHVDGPGLSSLTSRAGEALASYVTSVSVPSTPLGSTTSSSSSYPDLPVVQRAPSAAQEMVQTGRPSGRHGGGETEIPAWFEAAARKMLGERMGTDTLSMAELTLVNSAPSTQIAAASRTGAVSAAPSAPHAGGAESGDSKKGEGVDVDAIADEVYKQIMVMMDAARSRNGEPYL